MSNPGQPRVRYCFSCGEQIPLNAKFCTFCGERQEAQKAIQDKATERQPEPAQKFDPKMASDAAYHLLEVGSVFQGYTTIRLMNKDAEGIKYIAERDGAKYVLKVFFQSKFSSLDSLFSLQQRLKRLNKLDTAQTAKVVEINQSHDPAYMVAEYVNGMSLAQIKTKDPDRLTEEYVRDVARQLIQTAIEVRKQGLSLSKLTLTGVMAKEDGRIVVLSSGITYQEVDEREDVFAIGVIIAQLVSRNVMYKSIYDPDRLKAQKFAYINGASLSLNKFLSECLHRNILQRSASLVDILEDINKLPPLEADEIFSTQGKGPAILGEAITEVPKPKSQIEYPFFILIGVIIALLVMLFTTNIYSVVFGGKNEQIKFGGIFVPNDSTEVKIQVTQDLTRRYTTSDSVRVARRSNNVTGSRRDDPRLIYSANPIEASTAKTPAAITKRAPMPPAFKYIEGGTFGFNRLKENLNHNVSQSGFYISKYEVTQAEWNKYMMPADVSHVGDTLPVDNVSWVNILRYCNARSEDEGLEPAYKISSSNAAVVTCNFRANGYRLPTESEWEMAAKAGALFAYSGSDDPSGVAWYRENSGGRIRSTGGKSANAWGLHDMSGNVSEWCWDWYNAKYPSTLPTFINPTGPETGTQKVIRGGNVMNGEGRNLGILWREKGDPSRGYQFVGFRLVRTN